MVHRTAGLQVTVASENRVRIRLCGRTYQLGLQQAILFAFHLLRRKQCATAARVCQAALKLRGDSRQAAIMLARCQAGLKNYAACNQLLRGTFSRDGSSVAEQLHAAFIFCSLGMSREAARELTSAADKHPELPVIRLILADVMSG